MRRGVGVGAVKNLKAGQDKYREKGTSIQENLVEELSSNLDQFKKKLETFASKHQNAIKKDPQFREHFQEMCAQIGVDPLASSKGFWSELLGMGNFYYEIAVQAVEIVLATANIHGGVMPLGELQNRLNKARLQAQKTEVSCDDILRAMKSLDVLGKSCGVITSRKSKKDWLVFCVPEELSPDTATVVQYVAQSGSPAVNISDICKNIGWTEQRAKSVINSLICEGIVWVDHHKGVTSYWFPSIFLNSSESICLDK